MTLIHMTADWWTPPAAAGGRRKRKRFWKQYEKGDSEYIECPKKYNYFSKAQGCRYYYSYYY